VLHVDIIPTVATSGEGLTEALEWLHLAISEKRGVKKITVKEENKTVGSPSVVAGSESVVSAASYTSQIGAGWNKTWELFKSLFIAS
jgi:hypothetical protein